MATDQIVAKKYAVAAFELAKKSNSIDQFSSDLQKFTNFLSSQAIKEISNPTISKSDLKNIISEFGSNLNLSQNIISFLEIIAHARRINIISNITKHFIKLAKIENKILEVELISTVEAGKNTLSKINDLLKEQYPDSIIEINQTIKKDIFGGLILKIGSQMIDASLKTQLDNLKITLEQ